MPECVSCNSPLGHDTIQMGFDVCGKCRKCAGCGMSMSPKDIDFFRSLGIEGQPKHARCMSLSDSPEIKTKPQTLIAIINWCATIENTQTLFADMSFDQKYQFTQTLVRAAANASTLISKDKAIYENFLKEKAALESPAAPKPKKKDAVQRAAEVGIKTTSQSVARTKLSQRDKGIAAMMKLAGMDKETAAREYDANAARAAERNKPIA